MGIPQSAVDYTTVLDVLFFVPAAVLVVRLVRTGGRHMLSMMDMNADEIDVDLRASS
jgi:hypothetical protein